LFSLGWWDVAYVPEALRKFRHSDLRTVNSVVFFGLKVVQPPRERKEDEITPLQLGFQRHDLALQLVEPHST